MDLAPRTLTNNPIPTKRQAKSGARHPFLNDPVEIEPRHFAPVERTGFRVVEWGGTER
jgi:hypothetical protein